MEFPNRQKTYLAGIDLVTAECVVVGTHDGDIAMRRPRKVWFALFVDLTEAIS